MIHIVRKSTPRFTKSPSLVLIGLVVTEIHRFKNVKISNNLVPRVFVPLDQRSVNESSGSNYFEITKEITEFGPSGFSQSASMVHA